MSFDSFAERIIKGGTVTDADVNEWVLCRRRYSWWRRALRYFLTGERNG